MATEAVDLFQFGYVSRAHGLGGEVMVRTFDPASTVLDDVPRVVARQPNGEERELLVEAVREGSKGDLLVSFEGVARREDAERLKGCGLFVRRADLEAPEEGEFFQGDLVGLEVFTPDGALVGRVAEIWSTGPVPNLVIRSGDREELVPFAEEFIRKIDLAAGRMELVLPQYEG
jgi:16S rRNA processing protein RimM